MRPEDLSMHLERIDELCNSIIQQKNNDYSGPTRDVFQNFRSCEMIGVSVERGMLTRMLDKINRVGNLLNNPNPMVESEKIEDTLLDLVNYSKLLYLYKTTLGKQSS